MKFDLEDHTVALSHVLLENKEYAFKVSDTSLWKDNGVLEAKLTINGIDFPAELIEEVLQGLYSRCENFYKEKYNVNNFDDRVEERAKELLKEQADNAYERMGKLIEILDNPEVLLKPHWERN